MARVAGAVQRQKTRKCTGKIYSSEQISKQRKRQIKQCIEK